MVGLAPSPAGFVLAPLLVGMGQALVLAEMCGCPRKRLRPWVFGTAVGGVLGFAAAIATGAVVSIGVMVEFSSNTECGLDCALADVLIFAGAGAAAGYVVGLGQGAAAGLSRPGSWAGWSALAGIGFGCVLAATGYLFGYVFPSSPQIGPDTQADVEAPVDLLAALVWALAGAAYGGVTFGRLGPVLDAFPSPKPGR